MSSMSSKLVSVVQYTSQLLTGTKTTKEVLGLNPTASSRELKSELINFFSERLFNEIYGLDKNANESNAYPSILSQVAYVMKEKFIHPPAEAIQKLKIEKYRLGLNPNASDAVVYAFEIKRDLKDMLETIIEDVHGVKIPQTLSNKDELYAYLKKETAIVLRERHNRFKSMTDDEIYKRRINSALNITIKYIHGAA
ncbi:MAG: hypothetical protein HY094_02905 [Candidatus Melainabacteria bacterium]|nr:hypothetical protein [Candidatus Melainabacteria bacterium]